MAKLVAVAITVLFFAVMELPELRRRRLSRETWWFAGLMLGAGGLWFAHAAGLKLPALAPVIVRMLRPVGEAFFGP